jgi:formylglycine-generating enzyme required for sulfatase activity
LSELILREALVLREALGERRFSASDLPLTVGGAGSAIVLAGRPEGPEAYLGMHEDQLFVQPADAASVLHNGLPIANSTWLKGGDVVNFGAARLRIAQERDGLIVEVDDGAQGNITAPPIITASHVQGATSDDAEPIAAIRFRAPQATRTRRSIAVTPTQMALSVVGLVVLGLLWFIFTAISVGVVAEPTTANLDIRGKLFAVPLAGRYLLRPGEYELHASANGFTPARSKIVVTEAPNQSFAIKLQKLPGKLRIDVPASAQLTINGEPRGMAPGEVELPEGRHTVGLSAERYQVFSGEVVIEGAGKVQTFKPQLVPAWADVTVNSEPAGAQVFVGGEAKGVTPLKTEILAGNHPIELRLDGFKPWSTDVQVKANEPLSLGTIKLGLPDGRLAVRSEPSGASVSVAGVYRGVTPLEIEVRPDLVQALVLSKPGYENATREVRLAAGERTTLSVPLTGVFGEIAVRAQPSDAQVFVDGQAMGAANQTLRLVAATHDIEIRKAGFVDFKTSVTPRPGIPQVIETKLLTAEQTRLASTPATIRTKLGQELKLMPLGRFTMGSPRREPGRRANEAQRDVEFKRAFYMGVREVTNGEFRRFKADHKSSFVGQNSLDLDNQPVVNITWQQAAAYCNWLSEQEGLPPAYKKDGDSFVPVTPMTRGYRLASDAEWEWVARYGAGGKMRRYPWGDALPVERGSGNYADRSANIVLQDVIPDYDDGYITSAPVGKFPPNALGLYDIGGNVAEWVHDYYAVSVDATRVAVDPLGPEQGKPHVVRGASWRQSNVTDMRLSARDFSDSQRNDIGFRIARYVE